MKTALAILAGIVALVLLSLLWRTPGDERKAPEEGLPWQIDVAADGSSRVFGLTLGRSTLADARARLGSDVEVAVVGAAGEAGSLEAYFQTVAAGFIGGKMILTLDVTAETIAGMRERAVKTEYMESTTRKATLGAGDLPLANRAPIRAIAFVPSANLDEATVLGRFGIPAERIRGGGQVEHLLYPAKGLDVALDGKGKEVLQYVAPRDFARLRQPLVAQPP